MSTEEKKELLNKIKAENIVWIIYFALIGLCLYGNKIEKHYVLYQDPYSKKKYRQITIFIFIVAITVYLYFFCDNYKDVSHLKATDSRKKKDLSKLSLLGSTLILLSGVIFLYIAIVDTDLDVEIAFN
ncbi:MAG: hypothetical protein HFJ12_06135 [Bacilli bacterium]|nr:hypothetical protein [Bacilli bacterium]